MILLPSFSLFAPLNSLGDTCVGTPLPEIQLYNGESFNKCDTIEILQDLIFTAGPKENLEMAKISSQENF